jgi:NADH-quinone oxidoreductase subunit M
VVFGEVANANVAELKDVNKREFLVLAILAVCVLGMGLYPRMFGDLMHESVNDLIRVAASSKLPQ